MHSCNMRYLVSIFALTVVLAACDAWCAARRSLIPRKLDGTVTQKESRPEKHPGEDDVCLLNMTDSGWIQVDSAIHSRVSVGDKLTKTLGSRTLMVNGHGQELDWSRDVCGMLFALPTTIVAAAILGLLAARQSNGLARNKRMHPSRK